MAGGFLFDAEAERLDRAVSLVWQLYKREQWGRLNALGLNEREHAPALDAASEHAALRRKKLGERGAALLVSLCPVVFAAALKAHWQYLLATGATRRAFYALVDGARGEAGGNQNGAA